MNFSHRHATASSLKQTIDANATITTTLVVKTSIPFHLKDGGFNKEEFAELSDAIVTYIKENDFIDKADIIPSD